jgi:hypothetical protein
MLYAKRRGTAPSPLYQGEKGYLVLKCNYDTVSGGEEIDISSSTVIVEEAYEKRIDTSISREHLTNLCFSGGIGRLISWG